MLQRLLGHTTLMMTNRYCQAVGCYDAVEAHKQYSPVDRLGKQTNRNYALLRTTIQSRFQLLYREIGRQE